MKKYLPVIAVLGLIAVLTGCENVRTDATPTQPGIYSSSFSLTPGGCSQVMNGYNQLPVDLYHAGLCFERGIAGLVDLAQAIESYNMAARWGIPEAAQALQRLGKPVPPADLMQRRTDQEKHIHDKKIEKEKMQIQKDQGYPYPHHHHYHHHHRCKSSLCW